MWTDKNPFLLGPFEPLSNEYDLPEVRVEGEIPRELTGGLYRTGTNQHFRPANPDAFHWFDGDGMVHAFRLNDGRASYCNRLVETDGLKLERAAGRSLYNGIFGRSGVAQPPLPPGAPPIKTPAGINVVTLGGKVLTSHECDSFYWEIDRHSLKTLGKYDFGGNFTSMITAHPHTDPATGETLFYALENDPDAIECFALSPTGEVTSRHRVDLPNAPFVHDFIFTPRYYVFIFGPIRCQPYSPARTASGLSAMTLDAESPGRVLVVSRADGKARWFETAETFTVGHYMNAYEDGDRIVLDASVTRTLHRSPGIAVEDFFPFPRSPHPSPFAGPELHRITIDLASGSVVSDRVGDFAAEFVRPNETLMGRPQRYGYMAGIHAPSAETKGFNCVVKHDYQTGRSSFQRLNDRYEMTPGEQVFVPRAGAVDEDDGWVMGVWYDPRINASEMVILNAQDLDGEPAARLKLDHRVPLGFHGNWIADP